MALLEAKKLTSQYQKEADKCNSGMETCEEAREKAEAALVSQKQETAMWENRARQKGWKDVKANVQSQGVAAKVILEKAFSLAANEFAIAWGYEDSLRSLHGKLEMIRVKLQDAERRNGTEAVKVWMKQLRDVVSEADDVLDVVQYEVLRHEVKKRDQITNMLDFLSNFIKFLFSREMGNKIENINTKLSDINKQALDLGLHNEPQGPIPNSLRNETHSYLDEFKIVGREKDELHIVELLTESRKEEKLTVVPVVGMGGIGKTTLAKSVYNNQKIQKQFDVKVWLCVSVKVNISRLLEMIYESLTSKKCEPPTTEKLITKLREELGSKIYLLVLDDVWDEERTYWDDFRNDDSWFMFNERAKPLPELEEIGRDIVKKCRGLPLLVK
nr:CC-NBS-LRR resistance protein [Tanacetum cinerariifolium]